MSSNLSSLDASDVSQEGHELLSAEMLAALARTFTLLGALALVELDAYMRGVGDATADALCAALALYVAITGAVHCLRPHLRRALVPVAAVDVLVITTIVYWTGGIGSMYYPLYFLPIMQAAVRLRLRDALATSVLAGVCYAALVCLGVSHPRGDVTAFAKIATFVCIATFLAFFSGILMRETRAHRQESRRTLELYGVATALQRVYQLPGSLHQVLQCVARAMPASRAEIWQVTKSGTVELLASLPENDSPPEAAPDEVRHVIENGGALLRHGGDRRRGVLSHGTTEPFKPSLACVAAELSGGVLGAVRIVGMPERRPLSEADLTTLGVVAAQIAVALDAARLHDELAEQAMTDSLTGLVNRGEFWRRVKTTFRDEGNFPVSVAMLDVDSLKAINDTHGHLVGDQALVEAASLFRSHIGEGGVAARYGGDEFAMVLPRTTAREAHALMRHLLNSADALSAEQEGGARISFSVGVACADSPDREAEALVAAADVALYQAKGRGGGKVVLAAHAADETPGAPALREDRALNGNTGPAPLPNPGPSCA